MFKKHIRELERINIIDMAQIHEAQQLHTVIISCLSRLSICVCASFSFIPYSYYLRVILPQLRKGRTTFFMFKCCCCEFWKMSCFGQMVAFSVSPVSPDFHVRVQKCFLCISESKCHKMKKQAEMTGLL